ncbi:MAG: hypothetical protein GC201_06625 [Alphaproteobacteria bacterium]|nr:hypothetical protein [Alphaproteobacteria bacterium]
MKTAFSALAAALLLAACAETPATSHIAEIKALTEQVTGLKCPAADPVIIYRRGEAKAWTPGGPLTGGLISMPVRYDPARPEGNAWLASPQGQWRVAEEVAHTCGADEAQARAVKCRWWTCG